MTKDSDIGKNSEIATALENAANTLKNIGFSGEAEKFTDKAKIISLGYVDPDEHIATLRMIDNAQNRVSEAMKRQERIIAEGPGESLEKIKSLQQRTLESVKRQLYELEKFCNRSLIQFAEITELAVNHFLESVENNWDEWAENTDTKPFFGEKEIYRLKNSRGLDFKSLLNSMIENLSPLTNLIYQKIRLGVENYMIDGYISDKLSRSVDYIEKSAEKSFKRKRFGYYANDVFEGIKFYSQGFETDIRQYFFDTALELLRMHNEPVPDNENIEGLFLMSLIFGYDDSNIFENNYHLKNIPLESYFAYSLFFKLTDSISAELDNRRLYIDVVNAFLPEKEVLEQSDTALVGKTLLKSFKEPYCSYLKSCRKDIVSNVLNIFEKNYEKNILKTLHYCMRAVEDEGKLLLNLIEAMESGKALPDYNAAYSKLEESYNAVDNAIDCWFDL